jgi:hypothetical protein
MVVKGNLEQERAAVIDEYLFMLNGSKEILLAASGQIGVEGADK